MTETTPFNQRDYLGDKADVSALVKYAADLEAENEKLRTLVGKAVYAWDEAGDQDACVVACMEIATAMRNNA